MATRKNGNGKQDTNVTLADVVRELRSMSGKLDGLREDVQGLGKRMDGTLRRDQAFEARISKLETEVAKLKRKGG